METNAVEKKSRENQPDGEWDDRKDYALRRQALRNVKSRFPMLIHFVIYLSINLLLFFINLVTFNGFWWALWPLFGWGLGLSCHAVTSLLIPSIDNVRRRLYHEEINRLRSRA